MRKIWWMAVLAVAVAAGVRCKRANGAYCDDVRPCPSGFACDTVARECQVSSLSGADLAGISTDMAGCTCSNPMPICVAMQCTSCLSTSDPEGACAAASPSAPHCETSGPSAGDCVGCRDANDCGGMTPFCDTTTNMCRGCIADGECPSLICDLTPGSTTHGQCIPASNVVYADPAGSNGDGKTPATAKKKIMDAINAAVGLNPARLYVHVAAATYDEGVGVMGAGTAAYLVGADGAIIHRTGPGDGLGAQNNGTLTVRNLIVTADKGNASNCQTSGTLTIYGSQLINSSQLGVYTVACTLTLDGVWISNNMGGGISVSSDFKIINTIITNNVGAGGFTQVTAGTNMTFSNNTVANNTSSVTAAAGVTCVTAGSFDVTNTILYNNMKGGTISETNCGGSFDANDDVSAGPQSTVDLTMQTPGFKMGATMSPDYYHLLPTSPCVGEGSPMFAPDHDFDLDPRPTPSTGKFDIGADEQP